MIGVHTSLDRYRTAVAELPLSARLARPEDAEVIVAAAVEAVPAVCSTLVLVDPAFGRLDADVGAVTVVLDRPWLRADVAAEVGAHPDSALFAVECSSSAADLPALVRDALGWLRVLGGEDLSLDAAHASSRGAIAQLRVAGVPATLIATVRVGGATSRLRATAVGVERIEVSADRSGASVDVMTDAGATRLPRRWESRERMTLRRALAVAASGQCDDLLRARADDRLAAAILGAHNFE